MAQTNDRPAPIESNLTPEDVTGLANIRRRRELIGAPLWARVGAEAERLCIALEQGEPTTPASRPPRKSLRALTWNIERGLQLDRVIPFIKEHPEARQADVLLLNEVDLGMARSGNRHVAREIAEALGFYYAFGNSYLCLGHGDVRDGTSDQANSVGLHGNAIVSRYPITHAENVSLAVTKDKFHSYEKRLGHKKSMFAVLDHPHGEVAVVAAHLDPYASPQQRADQLEDLLVAVDERVGDRPVLLGGDLNSTTYDLESTLALAKNLWRKVLRGGFPHAIAHYMTPHLLYDKPLFDRLRHHNFEVEAFNDMGAGTTRYEVGTHDSESKIKEHLPGVFVSIVRYKLRPWNGCVPIKVDWFAGRGVRPLGAGEITESDGRRSISPTVLERARHDGEWISDHDPVMVDVSW